MPYQVRMFWDGYDPHPAFADLDQAISYAKGLLARLPEDAHIETEVQVLDSNDRIVFEYTLGALRLALFIELKYKPVGPLRNFNERLALTVSRVFSHLL